MTRARASASGIVRRFHSARAPDFSFRVGVQPSHRDTESVEPAQARDEKKHDDDYDEENEEDEENDEEEAEEDAGEEEEEWEEGKEEDDD